MELQYYGANCLKITTKKVSIVIDDNLDQLGLKSITKPTDISLRTSPTLIPEAKEALFKAETPGEYEISGVIINGIAARAHMDEEDKRGAVIYTITDEIKVVVVGHIYPELSEEQLEKIGLVDIAIVPVGNNGYTLDGMGALKLVKQIEPKIVIPTHYNDKSIKYEVPQVELSEALKNMTMEPAETVAKYKIKPNELSDTTRLVVLERQ